MDMYQMDGALDKKPVLCLDNRQIQLAKIAEAKVGQEFGLTAKAKVVAVEAGVGPDGLPSNELHLELDALALDAGEPDPMKTIEDMYPSHRGASV